MELSVNWSGVKNSKYNGILQTKIKRKLMLHLIHFLLVCFIIFLWAYLIFFCSPSSSMSLALYIIILPEQSLDSVAIKARKAHLEMNDFQIFD